MSGNSLKRIAVYATLIVSGWLSAGTAAAADDTAGSAAPAELRFRYYAELAKQDFLTLFVPKEKYLFELVRNITSELERRRAEGADLAELGIDELTTPEEKIRSQYEQELELLVRLMDDIQTLEIQAKRKADLEVLDALEKLKKRLRTILETRNIDMTERRLSGGAADSLSGGENGANTAPDSASAMRKETIRTIYEEWQLNRLLTYKVEQTGYEILRTRLLKTATPRQEERMFRRALKSALESYNNRDFPLARLLLQDIIGTYSGERVLDDLYFYTGESCYGLNLLDESLSYYTDLIRLYPDSPYAARALLKQTFIYYIYGDYEKLVDTYTRVLARASLLDDEQLGVVSYLVGFVHYINGESGKALSSLRHVRAGTRFYYPGVYLTASCHTSMGNDSLAMPIYQRIIDTPNKGNRDPVLGQIRNNALLKMGMLYYEQGNDALATHFFSQVTENFQNYDLSLMGKAWSAYRSGRPGEALKNVEEVLHSSLLSNYTYEARVLAASSKDLLGKSEEAITDLESVYAAGYVAGIREDEDEVRFRTRLNEFEMTQRELADARDREQFRNLDEIRIFLENVQPDSDPALPAGSDDVFAEETAEIRHKIASLDQLEKEAEQKNDAGALSEIRKIRSHLINLLADHTKRFSAGSENPAEDPLIKRMGTSEFLRYSYQTLLSETVGRKQEVEAELGQVAARLEDARSRENFTSIVEGEIREEELNDYYGRLNRYEIWLRENMPGDVNIEVDRWASFSGYGISSINFARIKECERNIEQISSIIENIDYIFTDKRRNMDNRIKGLLLDVAKIEEQMRKEADQRSLNEKERFFRVDYFNKRRRESVINNIDEIVRKQTEEAGGEK
ncbi:tetratricopeptide repeat protein [bacterium]|nr:tetratricopeptide repeat protein [bacterium]